MTFTVPPYLTARQSQVLRFIESETKAGRRFPTRRQISDHCGWKNEGGAYDCLNVLVGSGYLTRSYQRNLDGFGVKKRGWQYELAGKMRSC